MTHTDINTNVHTHIQVWNLLSELHARLGDTHESKTYAEIASRISGNTPDAAEGHFLYANSLMTENHYGDARLRYYRAIRLDPTHVNSMVNLGVVLGNNNAYAEAINVYRKALVIQVYIHRSINMYTCTYINAKSNNRYINM